MIFSCQKNERPIKSSKMILETAKQIGLEIKNTQYIVFMTSDGCSGCTEFVTNWFIDNEDNLDSSLIQIVFSGSNRNEQIKEFNLSDTSFKIKNDKDGIMVKKGVVSLYPHIYKLTNGFISQDFEISPANANQKSLEAYFY